MFSALVKPLDPGDSTMNAIAKTPAAGTSHRPAKAAAGSTCKLTLTIGATSYVVKPIAAADFGERRRVRLSPLGSNAKPIIVAETIYGPTCHACDGDDRCDHSRALVACGMIRR